MNSILSNVRIQWLIRRIPDWGGWIGTFVMAVVGFYGTLSPGNQEIVNHLLSGNWQSITLGALVPFIVLVYSQVISLRATAKPKQVEKVGGKPVEVTAPRKSLIDILQGK